jgi:hypothetical protein
MQRTGLLLEVLYLYQPAVRGGPLRFNPWTRHGSNALYSMENGSYLRKPQTVLRQARPLHQLLSERGALLALRSTRAGGEAGAHVGNDLPDLLA